MTDTDRRTMRHVLRREIAGTIGLLTDEHDFRAMRRYRSFTFDDHTTYLEQVEALLRSRAAQGTHTTIALFDPEDYAVFCAGTGLDPDTLASRTRFTAELATTGPTPNWSRSSSTKPSDRPPGSTPRRFWHASAPASPAARTSAARPSTAPRLSSPASSTPRHPATATLCAA